MRMARVDLVDRFIILQNLNIKFYEEVNPMMAKSKSELACAHELNGQLTQQLDQLSKKESFLNITLSNKHLETHDLMAQVQEMRAVQMEGATSQLNHKLIDPAVSHVFEKMKSELASHKRKRQEALEDASALKFNPDSQMGKRLVAKCRQLSQENRELSEMVSKLEDEVAVESQVVRETRTHQLEFERFMLEMEDQLESLQGVVVSQNCSTQTLNLKLSNLTDQNKLLRIQLEAKSRPTREMYTMVTGEDLGVKEGRHKSDAEGGSHKEVKRKDDHVKNNHVNRASSKGRSKKDKGDKERGDKERSEKDRVDKDRGDKERSEKGRKRTHDGREVDKRTRHRSKSRNNHEVSNGHRR